MLIKDKDFSVSIKHGHILYCFFLCCLFPFEIGKKRENKTHRKISHSTVLTFFLLTLCRYCFVVAATGYNVTRIISTLNTLSRAINDHLLHLPFYLHTGEREDRYAFDCLPFSDAQWRDCLFKDNFQCSAIWNPRSEKLIGILSGNVTWEEGLVFLCATRGHAESSLNKQFCTLQVEGGGILDATIEYFRLSDNTQCLVEKKILTVSIFCLITVG